MIAPYVVVLQSHLLGRLPSVVVAPLLSDDGRSAYVEASVIVDLLGAQYILSALELGVVDAEALRRPVGSLKDYEYDIRRALDRVFTGF
jgi:toxin CcdB